MRLSPMSLLSLRALITDALRKDVGPVGDVTTIAVINSTRQACAQCIAKESGVISGISVLELVFLTADPKIIVTARVKDGDKVNKGDIIADVNGPACGILAGERVALEFLRRMSGIATKTHLFVEAVHGTGVTILDTRKTFPGYGELDKQAVRDGGGTNHRANLSEMGLIKNNHIDLLGGDVTRATQVFKKAYPNIPLEVEVRNQSELIVALAAKPDRILLDNMTVVQIRKAVIIRNKYTSKTGKKIPLEASGNMTLSRVREVADTGVEYISIGELTHTVKSLDLSLHVLHGT
jgi:nicotinate-nucleotide pyrophosphorylase (carboxylating)